MHILFPFAAILRLETMAGATASRKKVRSAVGVSAAGKPPPIRNAWGVLWRVNLKELGVANARRAIVLLRAFDSNKRNKRLKVEVRGSRATFRFSRPLAYKHVWRHVDAILGKSCGEGT